MKKFIVTTTINQPTIALKKYAAMEDWNLIVVGDLKTPHETYKNYDYLSPEYQKEKYPDLSDVIGWNCIQRRSIGIVEAYNRGADVIATVDDDNIPYDDWGCDLYINQEIDGVDLYEPTMYNVFDPLSVTYRPDIWHRGYPIEYVPVRDRVEYKGKITRKVLVQADLWDGDPDIDAIARMSIKPIVKYDQGLNPYCSNKISPFNSQNTFLSREVIPNYMLFPHTGRMDDIWGAYVLQHYHPNCVTYNRPSVYQDRNVQDLTVNLEKEILGYKYTHKLVNDLENYTKYLPKESQKFEEIYKSSLK